MINRNTDLYEIAKTFLRKIPKQRTSACEAIKTLTKKK